MDVEVQQIVFRNEHSGFTVARGVCAEIDTAVTVVGTALDMRVGDRISLEGEWSEHPRYGRQFRFSRCQVHTPATAAGIEAFLASGLFPGIGPAMAERIIDRFGTQALQIIAHEPDRLEEVSGIGPQRVAAISEAWRTHQDERDGLLFLESHGMPAALAARVVRHFGAQTVAVIRQDPFVLMREMRGVGFVTADRVAAALGIGADTPPRICAGIVHVLERNRDNGHVFLPAGLLRRSAAELLGVPAAAVEAQIRQLQAQGDLVVETDAAPGAALPNDAAVYTAVLYSCEAGIAQRLEELLHAPASALRPDAERSLSWVRRHIPITLAPQQELAVRTALASKVMVITGGPGTGKSTIIDAILKVYSRQACDVVLAAPTGRAAKRMSELTGRAAHTIHRLLRYNPGENSFEHDRLNPLKADLVVVDEASMIDTELLFSLLQAIPPHATLILVGDVHQLPSVGPGAVLRDIIAAACVPVVELCTIFRQAQESLIVVNAHRINAGKLPELPPGSSDASDFYFIERDDPADVHDQIMELVSERIPRHFAVDPVDDIQVIAPMRRGVVGVDALNVDLQSVLNPAAEGIPRAGTRLQVGDKVMQLRNNYEHEVFNGDLGRVVSLDMQGRGLSVCFDDRVIRYAADELEELSLAYAMSVHKSQGSEFPVVVLPVVMQHYVLLQRNLFYTAITRGRRLVVVVGSRRALAAAVANERILRRFTRLQQRLAGC